MTTMNETTKPTIPTPQRCDWCQAAARWAIQGQRANPVHACNGCLQYAADSALLSAPEATLSKIKPLLLGPEPQVGMIIRLHYTPGSHGKVYGGPITAVEDNRRMAGGEPNWRIEFEHDEKSSGRTGDPGTWKQLTDGGVAVVEVP